MTCHFCDKAGEITFGVAGRIAELKLCDFHAKMLYKGLAQYISGRYGERTIIFF
jgi:hypothetical protein